MIGNDRGRDRSVNDCHRILPKLPETLAAKRYNSPRYPWRGARGAFRKRIAQLRNGTRLHAIDGVIYDAKSVGNGAHCP